MSLISSGAHIIYPEQLCANCKVYVKWLMSFLSMKYLKISDFLKLCYNVFHPKFFSYNLYLPNKVVKLYLTLCTVCLFIKIYISANFSVTNINQKYLFSKLQMSWQMDICVYLQIFVHALWTCNVTNATTPEISIV